jgi:membrane fusion protein (multidrug efflux system)
MINKATIARRAGVEKSGISSLLALILVLAITVASAGCGSQSQAATSEDGEAEATEQSAEAPEGQEGAEKEKKSGKKDAKEGEEEEKAKVAVPVSVAAVEPGMVSAYLSATANLVAENQVRILAEAEGRVEKLLVDEGAFVSKGALLAALDSDDQSIALAKAEVKLDNARMAFERGEDLHGKELISREEMDKLRMDFEIAKQEIAEAEFRLRQTEIRAPFSGQISERMIQVGKHVRNGDELFQITDFEPLVARLYFPESDIMGLEAGRSVRMTLSADPSVQFEGRIRHVSDVVDVSTGTVKVTVEAPRAPEGVRPGSFVTVGIVREQRAGVLRLPKEAVIRELRSAHVFVAEDNVARKREVTLGLEEGDFVEAIAGVETGEKVIVLGQGGLKDGSEIEILSPSGDGVRES